MINFSKIEQKILEYWKQNEIFEKSVEKQAPKGDYVFYDGPPFATGLPHYGHILGSVIKDVVPRYWTMKGYRVPRRWGWDCHGLPIENLIEKKLGISGKRDIEQKVGIKKFNRECRSDVLQYAREWKKIVDRIGRWIEFDNAYKTMDASYMESVWWALKKIWDKGLIYKGRKVLMYCPRCETPVSKAEVAMDNSYKNITEESIIAKFKLKKNDKLEKLKEIKEIDGDIYFLSWTTTPWTLPANVALAVGADIQYSIISCQLTVNNKKVTEYYILASELIEKLMEGEYKIIKEFKGKDLEGIGYEPLVDIPALAETGKRAWYVTQADFVTVEEGTGIVHTAVMYGEDDYNLGVEKDLPIVPLLDQKGNFNQFAPEFIRGKYFKTAEVEIKKYLFKKGLVFKTEDYTHAYPHCWRCDTQLFYNAIEAWFIDVQKIKDRAVELNEKINWYPQHLKHGRFLNILETAPDWNISRNRYWATPLPFWKCGNTSALNHLNTETQKNGKGCGNVECIGSIKELREKAINFDEIYSSDNLDEINLHKHLVDKIKLKCPECGGEMERVPEVIDCWVESASMPFAEHHYPFENHDVFKHRFPGQYIAEYIAQTRAWFYYMHIMSVLLFDNVSFQNCVSTGTILNDKGEKLSKSKRNFTDPWQIINKYGVDSLRYYLMTSVVMQAENLFFKDEAVREVYNKVILLALNVLVFYKIFSQGVKVDNLEDKDLENVLDIWITSKLEKLKQEVTENMDNYNTVKAGRPIKDFINDLSTWYVRRSRDRFKGEDKEDKLRALKTLRHVLFHLARVMAPFMPYLAEHIYQELKGRKESVHLEEWPEVRKELIDQKVLDYMTITRQVVELGLAKRAEAGIKVRQPLSQLSVINYQLSDEYVELIKDELNVKEVKQEKGEGELKVEFDMEITEELKKEGMVRELVRAINNIRKKMKLTVQDKVKVRYTWDDEAMSDVMAEYNKEIRKQVLADKIKRVDEDLEKVKVNEVEVGIKIEACPVK